MSLRGLNGFNSDTVRKKLDVLIPLYEKLLEEEGKPYRRVEIARLVQPGENRPFVERRKQG
jgi:hypothetical protein